MQTDHRVVFDILIDFLLLADTGRVDKVEVESEFLVTGVDAVSGGPGYVGHDMPVLSDKGIDKGGFPGVGAPHDGEFRKLLEVFAVVGRFGKSGDDFIQEVACAVAADRGDGIGISQSEAVEFRNVVKPVVGIDFVGDKNYGFLRLAENLGHMVVKVGDSVHGIDDEQYFVGLFDSHGDLLVDFPLEDVVGVDYPSAGIDNGEFAASPFDFAVLAVAGGAGGAVHDCLAGFGQTVEESGFPDIRAPYDGYKLAHISV